MRAGAWHDFQAGSIVSRALLLVVLFSPLGGIGGGLAEDKDLVEQGRRIYVEGRLSNGQALVGSRKSGDVLKGADAACTNCHRPSGMGSVEGNLRVAPISGRYMFANANDRPMANADGIRGKALTQAHEPYSDETLERVLGLGVNVSGRILSTLMPQYRLAPEDMRALTAYLKVLSRDYSEGVSKDVIRFATVITPEVSPQRRALFKQMLTSAVQVKNASTSPRRRYMTSAASFVTQSERKWDIEFWELQGEPSNWPAQMDAWYRARPVFALLSGLSDANWGTVASFCTDRHIPCWFPSVQAPELGEPSYGLYFHNGLVLDAQVLASDIQAQAPPLQSRWTQVFSAGSPGANGAASLKKALTGNNTAVRDIALAQTDDRQFNALLNAASADESLALWLNPSQVLASMQSQPPTKASVYIFSPLWADADLKAIPAKWRSKVKVVYPYELPMARQANLATLHAWLKLRGIPLEDELLQSEVFFALNLMNDTLQEMIDNMYRDYLIERAEDNLGKRETSKAEQENHDRKTLGRVAAYSVRNEADKGPVNEATDALSAQRRAFAVGESAGTTSYPKLTLAPGQNFASRGAYILDLEVLFKPKPEAGFDWIIP